jgi:hypothetical protein
VTIIRASFVLQYCDNNQGFVCPEYCDNNQGFVCPAVLYSRLILIFSAIQLIEWFAEWGREGSTVDSRWPGTHTLTAASQGPWTHPSVAVWQQPNW